jgi:hypothetical protein
MRYNSGTTAKTLLTNTPLTLNKNYKLAMVVGEREAEFWIDDVLYGEMDVPAGQSSPFMQTSLPYFVQKYNNGTVGSSPSCILKVGDITVIQVDVDSNKLRHHQMAGQGFS